MSVERSTTTLDARVVNCPKCGAQLALHRSNAPRIDSAGFESYSFECKCGRSLRGIIDPYDDKLLLTDG
jgi:hypothetical protein